MFCTKCGHNYEDENFCTECGAPVSGSAPIQQVPQFSSNPQQRPPKKKTALIVIGVIVGLMILVGLINAATGEDIVETTASVKVTTTSTTIKESTEFTNTTEESTEFTIKIGAIMPMTGDVSLYGTATVNSINIAVDEINKAGGINGKQVELIFEDDENKPEKSVDAYNKLVTKDKVDVIIGCLTSKCSLAVAPLAQRDKIPMISPTSTNLDVTLVGDYIFRTCYIDPFQSTVCANFATDMLGKKSAAIVFDSGNDYSKGLATEFEKQFVAKGGTIVAKEAYSLNDQDFSAILTNVKDAGPDILFIPDYYSKVSLIAKQVRALGMTDLVMLGGDGWDEIANNAGEEVLGCYYINNFSADSTEPLAVEFVKKYKAAYNNQTPNALAALGYDAMMIVGDAFKAANSTDKTKVRDAIAKTDGKFLTGRISFDENRNPIKSAVILKLGMTEGKLSANYFATVNP